MKILEKLFHRNKPTQNDGLTQPEREAIIDLLTLGIYADNHLTLAEDQAFEEITEKMQWESKTDISYYLQTAIERVRTVRSSEDAVTDFIDFVGERLESRTSAGQALELLQRLFYSDGKAKAENDFYQKVEGMLRTKLG